MKNKKLTLIASVILVIAMLFGTVTASATDLAPTTGAPVLESTTELETTEAPTTEEPTTEAPTTEEPTTEEPTTEEPTTEETTTEPEDGWYDNSDFETEEEKEAYDEGFWDGYYDGYGDARDDYNGQDYDDGYNDGWDDGYESGEWDGYDEGYYDGYYEGYYEAMNSEKDVVTIFDRIDAFYEDLLERIELIKEKFIEFFQKLFKTGDYAVTEEAYPDTDFIPSPDQATLAGDEDAQALCDEFNALINNFPDNHGGVDVTKTAEVGIEITDCPGGEIVKKLVQPVVDEYLIDSESTEYFYEDDYVYFFQETYVDPAGLVSAKKTVNEDGTTDYEFKLLAEACFYNGYHTYPVTIEDGEAVEAYGLYHYNVADVIIVEYFYYDEVTVTKAEIVYPGATITAKTDAQGRLVEYNIDMPVNGEATGKFGLVKVDIGLDGYRNEGYSMVYDD